jgi:glycosyltransferase involved in cell wall biosynthesis
MKPRIAFVTHFCPHYRRRLFERIGERMETDFYFFADQRMRHWNRRIPLESGGRFRTVELRRVRIAGEPLLPGLVLALTRRRYDAVVKCLNGKLMTAFTVLLCRVRGFPLVIWTGMWYHPRTPFHRLTRPLTELVYRTADAIVVYGDHVKAFLMESAGIPAEKIFVAGQAVEGEHFAGVDPVRNGHARVLYIGQFEERKGLFDLLDAFAQVPDPDARLRLIGNGSQEQAIAERARADGRIEIAGYVAQSELPEELAQARCLVLPSVTTAIDKEPWGLVVNEAMHAGIPVVATDGVGAAAGGLVDDGRNGFVVPERDPAALARALRHLVDEPDAAARFGDQARQDVSRFTHERMADAFAAAVDYAIARRAR